MFEQGEILLIPVPFSNLSTVKKRPVLVLSNNAHNSSNKDIIVIAIKIIGKISYTVLSNVYNEFVKLFSP